MVYQWEPDTQYNLGDVVVFESHKYKIVQPHRSQSDWTPPVTPALWARVPEEYGGQSEAVPPSYQPQHHEEKPWDEHQHQKVDIPHEDQKKNWWDLDDKRKKELEIGGGLALGVAALGAGLFAYKHHERSEGQQQSNDWVLQRWLNESQARTEAFYRDGPSAPVQWILVHGKNFPQYLIAGGEEDGQPLFISRSFHDGSIQVGKASPTLAEGASIGYGHEEISVNTFEVLVGAPHAIRWVEVHRNLKLDELGARPVEGGHEADGTPLYIAQAHYKGGVHPGKCGPHLRGAFIPYGGTEKEVSDYRVLCYA